MTPARTARRGHRCVSRRSPRHGHRGRGRSGRRRAASGRSAGQGPATASRGSTGHRLARLVEVEQVDADITSSGDGAHDGAQGLGGTAVAPDDLTEVIGVHAYFQDPALTPAPRPNRDLCRSAGRAPEPGLRPGSRRCRAPSARAPPRARYASLLASAASSAGAGSSAFASSFLAFFGAAFLDLGEVALPSDSPMVSLTAAWKSSALSGFGSATLSVPSAPGSPLYFLQ